MGLYEKNDLKKNPAIYIYTYIFESMHVKLPKYLCDNSICMESSAMKFSAH